MAVNMIDFALNPQEPLDAARWQWFRGRTVGLERGVPAHIVEKLATMGHDIRIDFDRSSYCRGQIIQLTKHGTLVGATEPRADGYIAAWR